MCQLQLELLYDLWEIAAHVWKKYQKYQITVQIHIA